MNTAATIGLQLGAMGLAALCVWGIAQIYALRGYARGPNTPPLQWRLVDSVLLTSLASLGLIFVSFAVVQFAQYS